MIKESGFLASLVIHGKNRATVTYIASSIQPQSRHHISSEALDPRGGDLTSYLQSQVIL